MSEAVGTSENLIATLTGSVSPDDIFILGAHFDTVAGSPGADDNASGVAGLLEAARVLAGRDFDSTIRIIAFAEEEDGLAGSTQHATAAYIAGDNLIGVLILEMIGYTCSTPGCQFVFNDISGCLNVEEEGIDIGTWVAPVVNTASFSMANIFSSVADTYVPSLETNWALVASKGDCFPDTRRSDHAPFWDWGFSAMMLTDTSEFRNPNYHLPTDTLATLDLAFATNVTRAAVAMVATQAGLRSSQPVPSVPSVSFGGLGVLGGLVFAIAVGALAVQRRRRAL